MADFNAEQAHETIVSLLTEIRAETKATNGRLRTVEQKVAVLTWAYGALLAVGGYLLSRVLS